MIALPITITFALIFLSGSCEGKQLHVYAGPEQMLNWQKAFDYCKYQSKNLVATLSMEEHKELGNAIQKCSEKCGKKLVHSWTAANDLDQDWKFVWKGLNKPVDMAMGNWQNNQPDHYYSDKYRETEHCVAAWNPDYTRYRKVFLNDRPCSEPNNFVCQ